MNIDMIRAAAARLEGHVRRTPLLNSPFLDELAGRRVWVKPECLQHTGSFKFRGGWSAVSALDPDTRARGVIAFSSGNQAQGVARTGMGFHIAPRQATATNLAAALAEILPDLSPHRARAEQLANEFHALGGPPAAADALETLTQSEGVDH